MHINDRAAMSPQLRRARRTLLTPDPMRSPRLLAPAIFCFCASVSAQGIYPGDPPKGAYTLPGGFEPVVQLRTFYFDEETTTGVERSAWALGGWAGVRSPWWG